MSKQEQANEIYNSKLGVGRRLVIDEIVSRLGVSNAYASTLYNNARKSNASTTAETKKHVEDLQTIRALDRVTLRMLRGELDAALSTVANKFGLTIDMGSMGFTNSEFTTRLKVSLGTADEAAKREWNKYAFMFGLKDSDFGRSFMSRGSRFTVTGMAPRSKKYPILATNANGTTYKFKTNVLK